MEVGMRPKAFDRPSSWAEGTCATDRFNAYVSDLSGVSDRPGTGTDVRSLRLGSSQYHNGPPNQGTKMTLARRVETMRAGHFSASSGPSSWATSGPGHLTVMMTERKVTVSLVVQMMPPFAVTSLPLGVADAL